MDYPFNTMNVHLVLNSSLHYCAKKKDIKGHTHVQRCDYDASPVLYALLHSITMVTMMQVTVAAKFILKHLHALFTTDCDAEDLSIFSCACRETRMLKCRHPPLLFFFLTTFS